MGQKTFCEFIIQSLNISYSMFEDQKHETVPEPRLKVSNCKCSSNLNGLVTSISIVVLLIIITIL